MTSSTTPGTRRLIRPSGPVVPGKESPTCLNCGRYARTDSTAAGGIRHLFGTIECDPEVTA